jgi:hypothetical protein
MQDRRLLIRDSDSRSYRRSNPEGMTVNSQGRKPLEERYITRLNAEGVAEILPPFRG